MIEILKALKPYIVVVAILGGLMFIASKSEDAAARIVLLAASLGLVWWFGYEDGYHKAERDADIRRISRDETFYSCKCGKYTGEKYGGVICDKCKKVVCAAGSLLRESW